MMQTDDAKMNVLMGADTIHQQLSLNFAMCVAAEHLHKLTAASSYNIILFRKLGDCFGRLTRNALNVQHLNGVRCADRRVGAGITACQARTTARQESPTSRAGSADFVSCVFVDAVTVLHEIARFEQSDQHLDRRAVLDDPPLRYPGSRGGPCEVGHARGVLAPRRGFQDPPGRLARPLVVQHPRTQDLEAVTPPHAMHQPGQAVG